MLRSWGPERWNRFPRAIALQQQTFESTTPTLSWGDLSCDPERELLKSSRHPYLPGGEQRAWAIPPFRALCSWATHLKIEIYHLHLSWPPSVKSAVFVVVHCSVSEHCLNLKSIEKSEPARGTDWLSAVYMKRFILCHISIESLRNMKRMEQSENRLKIMSATKM